TRLPEMLHDRNRSSFMPKRTLLLILGLFVVTLLLLYVALTPSKKMTSTTTPTGTMAPKPTMSQAHTTVTLSPAILTLSPTASGSVDVMVDSSDNKITGVQLEMTYDPKVVQIL